MCGRFTLTVPNFQALIESLGVSANAEDASLYRPRFNVAPSDRHWILTDVADDRRLLPAVWGIPNRFAGKGSFINARIETAATKPTFREAYALRRCLIPADGFYEWKNEDGKKKPFWFHAENRVPFLFAGLYETKPLLTFTILTQSADSTVLPVHARMPVIVGADHTSSWLQRAEQTTEESEIALNCRPVSMRVNSPRNDDPTLLDT